MHTARVAGRRTTEELEGYARHQSPLGFGVQELLHCPWPFCPGEKEIYLTDTDEFEPFAAEVMFYGIWWRYLVYIAPKRQAMYFRRMDAEVVKAWLEVEGYYEDIAWKGWQK